MNLYKILPTCGLALGVALVIATSAFTKAPEALHAFQYNPPVVGGVPSYSQTDVQNISNWSYTPVNARCSDEDQEACKVYVSDSYADQDGSSYTLDPSYSITASSDATAHVTATSDGTIPAYISNKDN